MIKLTKHHVAFTLPFLLIGILISSCNDEILDQYDNNHDATVVTEENPLYTFHLYGPLGRLEKDFDRTPESNQTTKMGVELGRHLFYDKRLSVNDKISCSSCHIQQNAFADPRRFSEGFNGELTARNSMSVVNMRWQSLFFWDGRAPSLEAQTLMPIQDHIEMGMNLSDLEAKLKDIDIYPAMFKSAFGNETITSDRVSKALAQFIRSIVSDSSKYDVAMNEGAKKIFNDEEYLGYTLFFRHVDPDIVKNKPGSDTRGANCGDCHNSALLTNNLFTNNGLDTIYNDPGYGKINPDPKYNATFKTPTLRNIELTAPYMHDGRFATLEEVIDHYDKHVQNHENLDLQIKYAGNYYPGRLDLTKAEKQAILAFLKTLTDQRLVTNAKYSDPFK